MACQSGRRGCTPRSSIKNLTTELIVTVPVGGWSLWSDQLVYPVRMQVRPGHSATPMRVPVEGQDRRAGAVEHTIHPTDDTGFPPSRPISSLLNRVLREKAHTNWCEISPPAQGNDAPLELRSMEVARAVTTRDKPVVGQAAQYLLHRCDECISRLAPRPTRQASAASWRARGDRRAHRRR